MPPVLLVSGQSIGKTYGTRNLFADLSIGFYVNERLGLIGPNGSGKSTLLKILAGLEEPDDGEVARKRDVRMAYLAQDEKFDPEKTIEEILFDAFPEGADEAESYRSVLDIIRKIEFPDAKRKTGTLSGGWLKRLAIARAVILKPDLLLLDEPTNHLDMEGILWLEEFLRNAPFAFVLVSHDRYLLENTANRIVELNKRYPEGFLKIEGNYSEFLKKREETIAAQNQKEATLSNKVRRELEWLQRGPKARTTKARFRIDNARRLKEDLSAVKYRNAQKKTVRIDFEATERKTKKLLEAKGLGIARANKTIFDNLSFKLGPGMRLCILGRNGSGKSSLLSVLSGSLSPDAGTVITADGVEVVTFDQKREQLDPSQPLKQALSPTGDSVVFQGRSVHVVTWARRFLFPTEHLTLPVSQLSGGEQARVLIANLMLRPVDILLLDEPTNDLDIPSLEVLEESLSEFPGAVVLITHDRFLIDRLSDVLLYLDGDGNAEFFADYDQWLQHRETRLSESGAAANAPKKKKPKGLTRDERKELNWIEKQIEKAEKESKVIQSKIDDPEIMSDAAKLAEFCAQLETNQAKVESYYRRWEKLESLES